MSIFAKAEYKEVVLPFIFDDNSGDLEANMISLEAYGNVLGENVYCYASYFADTVPVDEMAALLKNSLNKNVKVIFKIKKGKLKAFKIDLDSLAEACGDERITDLELAGWGLNKKSFREVSLDKSI